VKRLHGSASASTAASLEACLDLLKALEGYPTWYPEVVREVTVLERDEDGVVSRANVKLHVTYGPLEKNLELLVSLTVDPPSRVVLARVPHSASDSEEFEVRWRVEDGAERQLTVELHASLEVPRFLPVGQLADSFAKGFAEAAVGALARPPGDIG
jgi:hypothetical protein